MAFIETCHAGALLAILRTCGWRMEVASVCHWTVVALGHLNNREEGRRASSEAGHKLSFSIAEDGGSRVRDRQERI